MNIKSMTFMCFLAFTSWSCSHGMMRGSVAMKTSENEAHVCMGDGEVKSGDKVTAFRSECPIKGGVKEVQRTSGKSGEAVGRTGNTTNSPFTKNSECTKIKLGKGTVTKVLNEHYSVVIFEPGVQFDEGTFVEKN